MSTSTADKLAAASAARRESRTAGPAPVSSLSRFDLAAAAAQNPGTDERIPVSGGRDRQAPLPPAATPPAPVQSPASSARPPKTEMRNFTMRVPPNFTFDLEKMEVEAMNARTRVSRAAIVRVAVLNFARLAPDVRLKLLREAIEDACGAEAAAEG